jgi:hypothetical protein
LPACILSCSRQPVVIEGRLPDLRYDGEVVYLVPLEGARAENVDSACIRQGAFRFESSMGEGGDVFIIRTRPLLRLDLEELLVIKEPGRLRVRLDSVSSASGTALNDSLQQWKEEKQQYDALQSQLRKELKTADDARREYIIARKEQTERDHTRYAYHFVMGNRENVAGRFVYGLSKSLFTPEQRQALQMPD